MKLLKMLTPPVKASVIPVFVLAVAPVWAFDWPTGGGSVTIPSGVVAEIASAADVAAVAALDEIRFADETAAVVYTDSANALVLKADLIGAGNFAAVGAKKITLSGDNSALTGEMGLTNTPIEVVSRYGFGSRNTKRVRLYKTAKGDTLKFSATGSNLVLDAPVQVDGGFTFGPENTADTLIISNDLRETTGGSSDTTYLYFKNKVRIEDGSFGADSNHFYPNVLKKGTLWVTGNTRFKTASGTYVMLGDATSSCHWDIPASQVDAMSTLCPQVSSGLFYLEREDCFRSGAYLQPYVAEPPSGFVDLHGHDQTMIYLMGTSYNAATGPARYAIVKSDEPATITITQSNATLYEMPIRFGGAVSLTYAGKGTHRMRQVSDTTGTLTVSSGTIELFEGGGWDGTNIVICGTGTLACNSTASITSGKARLVVSDSGKMTVADGITITVDTAKFGETELDANSDGYTAADLVQLGVDGFVSLGAGSKIVVIKAGGGGEWTGWPDAPGEIVSVPNGATAVIEDGDVAKIATYAGISIGPMATVVARTTEPFVLSVPLSGFGSFQSEAPGLVILSDNSALQTPGAISTTVPQDVVVSNRFGLGSSATGKAVLVNDFTARHYLTFGGAAEVTNDVPIEISGSWSVGSADMDTTFVQNADLLRQVSGSGDELKYLFLLNRYTQLSGKFGSPDTFFFGGNNPSDTTTRAVVRLEPDCEIIGGKTFLYGQTSHNCEIYMNTSKLSVSELVPEISHLVRLHLGVDDFYSGNLSLYYQSKDPSAFLDLDGHGFTLAQLGMQPQRTNSVDVAQYAVITSAVPATVTVSGQQNVTHYLAIKFTDEAGFRLAGTDTYRFCSSAQSNTKGTLQVSAGTVAFDWGAGWIGSTNIVVDGGTLAISTNSTAEAVFSRAATVFVSDGGKLDFANEAENVVRRFCVNGEYLKPGVYGGSASAAQGEFVRDDIFGSTAPGVLRVLRGAPGQGILLIVR